MKTKLMNRSLRPLLAAGVCVGLALVSLQAQDRPDEPRPRPEPQKFARPAPDNIPFLGLVLGSVDESLAAQLDLRDGVGVLVLAVMPGSPAAKAGVLKHDVLRHFNDQLLVNEPQLQTLVRQAGIGADVTLKLLRKGREETVIVTLGAHEEFAAGPPGLAHEYGMHRPGPGGFGGPLPGNRVFNSPMNSDAFANKMRELSERLKLLEGEPDKIRQEVERFTREMQEQSNRAGRGAPDRQEGDVRKGADTETSRSSSRSSSSARTSTKPDGGVRVEIFSDGNNSEGGGQNSVTATADGKGNVIVTQTNSTRVAWNDGDGSGELQIENGKKKLTVKDREGKEIFSGPVDTADQRKDLPPQVREKLERIEKNVKVHAPESGSGKIDL